MPESSGNICVRDASELDYVIASFPSDDVPKSRMVECGLDGLRVFLLDWSDHREKCVGMVVEGVLLEHKIFVLSSSNTKSEPLESQS